LGLAFCLPADASALLWNLLSRRSIGTALSGAGLTFFAAAKKVREGLNNPFSALDV
jgi:homoserine kinase